MKHLTTLIAASIGLASFAAYETIPVKSGENSVNGPCAVVAVKAASTNTTGTIALKETIRVAYTSVTNVTHTNTFYSGTLTGGFLSCTTNMPLLGGTFHADGTAFTGGNVYLIINK